MTRLLHRSQTPEPHLRSCSGWWRASFRSDPWLGLASQGLSGDRQLQGNGTAPPISTASLNGRLPLSLLGANPDLGPAEDGFGGYYLHVDVAAGLTLFDFIGDEEYTVVLLVRPKNPSAPAAWIGDDQQLVGDGFGGWGIAWSTLGVALWHTDEDLDTEVQTPWIQCAPDELHMLVGRFDGTTLSLEVDAGGPEGVASTVVKKWGTPPGASQRLYVGRNWGEVFVVEDVFELITAQSVLSASEIAGFKAYFERRYEQTLLAAPPMFVWSVSTPEIEADIELAVSPATYAWVGVDGVPEIAIETSGGVATTTWSAVAATIEVSIDTTPPTTTWTAVAAEIDYPPALSLTAFHRDFTNPNWPGIASAGTSGSGSNDLTDPGTEPAQGTAQNGHGTANFNGTDDYLLADGTLDTYVAGTAFSGWVLLKADTGAAGAIWGDPGQLSTVLRLALNGSGSVTLSLNAGAVSVSRAVGTGAYALVTFRYNGTNLQIGVNEAPGAAGGGSSASYSTAISSLTEPVWLGGFTFGSFFDGHIAELGISDTALTDAQFTSVKSYVNARYALSL